MTIDIASLLTLGLKRGSLNNQLEEAQKIGTFRGGNCGIYEADGGTFAGYCPRLTLLRYLGYWDLGKENRTLMFEAGITNEISFINNIERSFTGTIYAQDNVGITAILDGSIRITGRPDLVLADPKDNPLLGVELKQICSVWTARDVMLGNPKLNHVIQASFYSMCLGLPYGYELWYTNRSDFVVAGYMQSPKFKFPKKGEKLSEYCGYDKEQKCNKVLPFSMGFKLRFDANGIVWFQQVSQSGEILKDWTETVVSKGGIIDYYAQLAAYVDTQAGLPPKPVTIDIYAEREGYTLCDYCELNLTCEKFSKDKAKWLANLPSNFINISSMKKETSNVIQETNTKSISSNSIHTTCSLCSKERTSKKITREITSV